MLDLKNKKVLVTGANGMIAYQLIKLLKQKDCDLTLLIFKTNLNILMMKNI